MLTTNQAAQRLGISRQRIEALIQSGKLPAERFGKAWMITEQSIKEYKPQPQGYPKGRPRK